MNKQTRNSSRTNRRGILLLIVLSLLSLFVLAGVTFILVAGQYRRASISGTIVERSGESPARLIDKVMLQLLRDSNSIESPLAGHSLLRDLYGNDYLHCLASDSAVAVAAPLNNTLWTLPVKNDPGATSLKLVDNYYDGRSLLFLDGNLRGTSVRILDYTVGVGADMTLDTADDTILIVIVKPDGSPADVQLDDRFLISGAPFNGTGVGMDFATSASLTAPVDLRHDGAAGYPIALLPRYSKIQDIGGYAIAINDVLEQMNVTGGADEPWDAVDYQNMFLARNPAAGTVVPSFHRPHLMKFWVEHLMTLPGSPLGGVASFAEAVSAFAFPYGEDGLKGTTDDNQAASMNGAVAVTSLNVAQREELVKIKEAIMFRPLHENNPNFSGSKAIYGKLDGTDWNPEDGVWDIDNDNNGVLDSLWMDAGLPEMTDAKGRSVKPLVAVLCQDMDGRINLNTVTNVALTPTTDPNTFVNVAVLPSGRGYGPAEIDTGGLTFNVSSLLSDRYGADLIPGVVGEDHNVVSPWEATYQKRYMIDSSSYRSLPDYLGNVAVLTTHWGQPHYNLGVWGNDDHTDDPYEVNLLSQNANDSIYQIAHLEHLLRYGDYDRQSTPARVTLGSVSLQGDTDISRINRRLFTTRSFHIPTLPRLLNTDQRAWLTSVAGNPFLLTLFRDGESPQSPTGTLLEFAMAVLNDGGVSDGLLAGELDTMLPMEIRRGQKVNINRFIGDGIDSNANGVVDEPGEQAAFLRDDFVRQLYCLMMYLRNPGDIVDFDADGIPTAAETARGYAQWAVNVLDFRDPDSIMTRFVYDPNPYDGWAPTDVVWGAERPELLISESLAWHDRNTEDLANDNGEGTVVGLLPTDDKDFDQVATPNGAFFIELYNPWLHAQEFSPAELASPALPQAVQLDKTTPVGGSPVWRILIADMFSKDLEPDAHLPSGEILPVGLVNRSVYFTTPPVVPDDGSVQFYAAPAGGFSVASGGYAVIGGGSAVGPDFVSQMGGRVDGAPDPIRQVTLRPTNASTAVKSVEVMNNTNLFLHDPVAELMASLEVVPIGLANVPGIPGLALGTTHHFSISEPFAGYPAIPGPMSEDEPFDDRALPGSRISQLLGTQFNFATIYLQRLANPLEPWHIDDNPYLTVDQAPVELTVFNGAANTPATNVHAEEAVAGMAVTSYTPRSVQRGDPTIISTSRVLWAAQGTPNPARTAEADHAETTIVHNFPFEFKHTLGFLNENYWLSGDAEMITTTGLEQSGSPLSISGTDTFSRLVWFDRPYANPLELIYVPKGNSGDLLDDYTEFNIAQSPFETTDMPAFGHLSNYFSSVPALSAHLYRIFDYVETPSPYVGTSTWFDVGAAYDMDPVNGHFDLSNFREPGRLNVNTINDAQVWGALTRRFPDFSVLWTAASGMDGLENPAIAGGVPQPTKIASPLRPAAAQNFMPDVAELLNTTREVHSTLLRSDTPTAIPPLPLLEDPLPVTASKNAYDRYLGLSRMGNLVSNQSNVFALWVTLGYFDYKDSDGDGTPDIGAEVGLETGDVNRHRMFYVIDRSIPVTFEPGHDHDADRTVLLRRFIE